MVTVSKIQFSFMMCQIWKYSSDCFYSQRRLGACSSVKSQKIHSNLQENPFKANLYTFPGAMSLMIIKPKTANMVQVGHFIQSQETNHIAELIYWKCPTSHKMIHHIILNVILLYGRLNKIISPKLAFLNLNFKRLLKMTNVL